MVIAIIGNWLPCSIFIYYLLQYKEKLALISVLIFFIYFLLYRFYSSLRHACATRVINGLWEWIEIQRPGSFETKDDQPTVNVFIADFVEIYNHKFCKIVVNLNEKLLVNPENLCKLDS